ncbi:MAG: class I adenylate-forming enzyme family protein [Acidimicrobiales bacterium]
MPPDATAFRNLVDPDVAARYRAEGWWGDVTLADHVARHARERPDGVAYVTDGGALTWSQYDDAANRVAGALVAAGVEPGERVAVVLPDGATVHAAFVGNERAGVTTVGIGARAGDTELRHLLTKTGASALISHASHRGRDMRAVVEELRAGGLRLSHHIVVPQVEHDMIDAPVIDAAVCATRRLGPDDLFMINSTSGTTGLPKCVLHTQNRWMYFHRAATTAGALSGDEVILGAVPAPFGFGLWTSHFTPTLLGVPCVVMEKFSAERALDLVEAHRVTMLCAVSTQFILMLAAVEARRIDLSSLRVMFTGGEAVPYDRARSFEARTGATVLQFYGSNESGLATGTTLEDPPERRLRTAGRVVAGTELRLFEDRRDVTASGRGQPGTRGPAVCLGYLDDPDANAQLFTDDGFVLHADVCTVDEDGWLTVVGRTSDIIIRGGKNISAAQVEEDVGAHPAVALAAAVPIADPVFGERVCVFAELRAGLTLTLDDLLRFLADRGTSKEQWPERLVVVDELPRSSGGKVAKGELRRRGWSPDES